MASYLAVTLNHFRPIQAWARSIGAKATLDMTTFELELKARNRYYVLNPRFLIRRENHIAHAAELTQDATGFIGWLPYKPLRWELSNDKLLFKALLKGASQPTPDNLEPSATPPWDFILKRSIGSFGHELAGPYRAGRSAQELPQPQPHGNPASRLFVERFIAGTNVKVWFWGNTPFHAHRDDYPAVLGDGTTPLRELVARRLRSVGIGREGQAPVAALPTGDRLAMESMVGFQGLAWDDVPQAGRAVWLDYRYGRRYDDGGASTNRSDNALHTFSAAERQHIDAIGRLLADALKPLFPVPVLYSLDGVLDPAGKLWWLEMNSNPILPPEGYPLILASLFGPASMTTEQAAEAGRDQIVTVTA